MIEIEFVKALLLTEMVECITAYVMGYRGKRFYAILLLINLITNPVLNYILLVLNFLKVFHYYQVIILETIVVIAEWGMFKYCIPKGKRLFLLSLIINLSSYIAGVLLFK